MLAIVATVLAIIKLLTPLGKLITLLIGAYKMVGKDKALIEDASKGIKQLAKQGNTLEMRFDELQKVWVDSFKGGEVIIKK